MNKRLLANLFDVYAKSFKVIKPEAYGTFICPLCLRAFTKDDIHNGKLSIEHIPPRSIKAVIKTMTCTQCNTTIGHKVQGFMANDASRKELEAGKKLKKPIRAKAQMPGLKVDVDIVSTDGRTWHAVSPMSVLPPYFRSEETGKKMVGTTATISLKGIGTREALDRAYLHSAYLALFYYLGYPYIMQPFMGEIRQQIIEGQPPIGARIYFPSWAKRRMPFFDPREKKIEVSLIGTAPNPSESCFAIYIAGELVLMPFVSDHHKVIRSKFDSILSEPAANARKRLPFHIRLLEIDPSCKYSARYVFENGSRVGDINTLKLSPVRGTDGTE